MSEEKLNEIRSVIDKYISPSLKADGGDITILDFKDNILKVILVGACSCCPHAKETLKYAVENTIHNMVDANIKVVTEDEF